MYFQPHQVPHHVEQQCESWADGHLMMWRSDVRANTQPAHPRWYWFYKVGMHILLILYCILCMLVIAPLAPGIGVRTEEVVAQFRQSDESSWIYYFMDWCVWALVFVVMAPALLVLWAMIFERRAWTDFQHESRCVKAVRIVTCGLYGLLCFVCLVLSLIPPSSGLPLRTEVLVRVERRAISYFYGVALTMLIAAVCFVFKEYVSQLATIQGSGAMRSQKDFMEFAQEHPHLFMTFSTLAHMKSKASDLLPEDSDQQEEADQTWKKLVQSYKEGTLPHAFLA